MSEALAQPKHRRAKPLLIVSVFIVLSDLLFIGLNYYSSLGSMQADTRRWAHSAAQVSRLGSLSFIAGCAGNELALFPPSAVFLPSENVSGQQPAQSRLGPF